MLEGNPVIDLPPGVGVGGGGGHFIYFDTKKKLDTTLTLINVCII